MRPAEMNYREGHGGWVVAETKCLGMFDNSSEKTPGRLRRTKTQLLRLLIEWLNGNQHHFVPNIRVYT